MSMKHQQVTDRRRGQWLSDRS